MNALHIQKGASQHSVYDLRSPFDDRQETHTLAVLVDNEAGVLARILADQGLYLSELAPVAVDLESVFLELTATAPVPGQHRQVDESAGAETASTAPTQGGWGV